MTKFTIWISIIIGMVQIAFAVDCNLGNKNTLGVLIIEDVGLSAVENDKVADLLKDYVTKPTNFNLTLQYVSSLWKMFNNNISCDNFEVIILIGDACKSSMGLFSFCNKPHLCINNNINVFSDTSISDTLMHYPSAVKTVDFLGHHIEIQGWKNKIINLFIAGENDFLLDEFTNILESYENNIHLYHIDDLHAIQSTIKDVFNKTEYLFTEAIADDPKIIFIGDIFTVLEIFDQMNILINDGTIINHFQSQWMVFTTSEVKKLIHQLNGIIAETDLQGVSIIQMKDMQVNSDESLMEVLDIIKVHAQNMSSWDLYSDTWCPNCICNTSVINISISDNSQRIPLSFQTMKTLINELPQSSVCTPFTFYVSSFSSGRPSIYQTKICSKDKKTFIKQDAFPVQEMGLNGKHFTIMTLESAPFVMIAEDGSGYYGMCIDLLRELSIIMNFTYTLKRSPDGEFGVIKNNTWTGMIGSLLKNESQLAFASLTASPSRKTVVDFVNYFQEYGGIIVKVPQRVENAYRVIAQPFDWSLWVAVLLSVPVAGVITWWFSIGLTKGLNKSPEPFDKYAEAQWYVCGALLTQGGDAPKHFPVRSFVGCWWVFCVVIVAAYGGSLYTFLTINLNKVPFETGEEMIRSSYTWGTSGGSFYLNELSESTDPVLKAIGNGIKKFAKSDPEVLSKNKEEHFIKVKKGGYAFISDVTILQRQAASDTSCEVFVLKQFKFLPLSLGIAIQKGSPYRGFFSKSVSQLRASGLLTVWQNKWWPSDACKGVYLADAGAITLVDMQSSFYVLVIGILIAYATLIGEYFLKRSSLMKTLLPW